MICEGQDNCCCSIAQSQKGYPCPFRQSPEEAAQYAKEVAPHLGIEDIHMDEPCATGDITAAYQMRPPP